MNEDADAVDRSSPQTVEVEVRVAALDEAVAQHRARSGSTATCTGRWAARLRSPGGSEARELTWLGCPRHRLQVLRREPGEAEMPLPHHTDVLSAFDLDADGNRDLLVGKFWGATGNRGYDVWRFDPALGRFVADTALSRLWNPAPVPGRPCVATSSNTSARDDASGVYCLHAGRWRLDSLEQNSWERASHTVQRVIAVRRGDSLVVVRSETQPDPD